MNMEELECIKCELVFENPKALRRHEESQHSSRNKQKNQRERPFECEVCQNCFKMKHHLKRHMLIHSDEKPFECEVCQKCFKGKDHIRRHMLVHLELDEKQCERPFECEVCQKCFKRKDNIRKHMLVHVVDKLSLHIFKVQFCMEHVSSLNIDLLIMKVYCIHFH